MDILFVATELGPYVKVGGLADVTASLTKALRGLGHKVTIVLPRFPVFEASGLLVARRLTPLKVPRGRATSSEVEVTLYDGRLASQVDLVLVDAAPGGKGLFDRPGVYGERGEDYPDNAQRFAILSRAAAELARLRAETTTPFDIVHCHDWPTALVPAFLRDLRRDVPALAATRCVLTIHNLSHQGVFPKELLPEIGLDWDAFSIDGIEFYGGLNILKHGILCADAVTTVSDSYAREIQTAAHGAKLDGVRRPRRRARRHPQRGRLPRLESRHRPGPRRPLRRATITSARLAATARSSEELGLPHRLRGAAARLRRAHRRAEGDRHRSSRPSRSSCASTDAQVVVAGDGDPALVMAVETVVARSQGRVVSRGPPARRSCTGSSRWPTSCSSPAGSSRAASCRCTRSGTVRCPSRARPAGSSIPSSTATRDSRRARASSSTSRATRGLLAALERAIAARGAAARGRASCDVSCGSIVAGTGRRGATSKCIGRSAR